MSAVKNEGTAFLTTTFFKELLSAHVKVIFSGCLKSVQLQWYYCRFIILNQTKNTCLHCQFKSKCSTYPTEIQSVNGKKKPTWNPIFTNPFLATLIQYVVWNPIYFWKSVVGLVHTAGFNAKAGYTPKDNPADFGPISPLPTILAMSRLTWWLYR